MPDICSNLETNEQIRLSKEQAEAQIALNEAKLGLPRSREIYLSDVHGEFETFNHLARSACGSIRALAHKVLQDNPCAIPEEELLGVIYYPEEKLPLLAGKSADKAGFYQALLTNLVAVLEEAGHGSSHIDMLEAMPLPYRAVATELLGLSAKHLNVAASKIACSASAESVILAFCSAIRAVCAGQIHLVGDVYDRGPHPDLVMEEVSSNPAIDIQWGNHDVVWMGAALGQRGCIAHVVRNCARYGNLSILTDAYGIDLRPLASFALSAYKDDPCVAFGLKGNPDLPAEELELNIKIQKAMAILQFKVEAKLIDENPSFGLENRKLLHRIDWQANTIEVDGTEYALTDTVFPTVDPNDPYALTPEEESAMASLERSFKNSEKLQRHMDLFLQKGSLYKIQNNALMFHACVPLNEDGSLKEANLYGNKLKGKALFDAVDAYVRDAFSATDPEKKKKGCDLLWYLWLGDASPLFAKSKMATFELYLIAEKEARKEVKNPFYTLYENEDTVNAIFEDFGMDPQHAYIVCGHVPVKVKDGESPIKCNGKVIVVDGGMSSAYRKTTGIGGLALVSDLNGLRLATLEPFAGKEAVLKENAELKAAVTAIREQASMPTVEDTDEGAVIRQRVTELEAALTE